MNHGYLIKIGMVRIMHKIKEILKSKKMIYFLIFILLFLLCYLFPYSHDDWAWGSQYGIDRLESHFEGYNGRWFGNFAVLLLTRSNLLKTFVMSLCLTGTLYYINKIIKSEKTTTILLSFLLLLATPYLVFRQGIVWTAGFSNYAISIFLCLIFIDANKELFEDKKPKISNLWLLLFVVLGFITTLFVEHITIYTVLLSIAVIIYTWIKLKKIYGFQISYFIGSILGTILMFSNSAYSQVATGNDGYRSFELSNFIISSINSFFHTIYKELIYNNTILNIVMVSLIGFVLIKWMKKNKKLNKLANIILFTIITFVIYSTVTRFMQVNILLKYTKYFNGLFTILFCVAILLFVIFFIQDKVTKKRMLFTLFSIVIMTSPLFVVTPIGSRCFLPTYILLILFVCDLMNYSFKKIEEKYIIKVFIPIIIVLYIYLMSIYGYVYKVNMERIKYLKSTEQESISLPKLPHSKYIWCPEPVNDEFMRRFKLFYQVDEDINIKFVPLKEWKK